MSAIHAVALGHLSIPQELSYAILGIQRPTSPSQLESPLAELTDRELDVLRCLAKGASNKEIASQLSISLTTVRTHVSNILRKLNLENAPRRPLRPPAGLGSIAILIILYVAGPLKRGLFV